MGFRKIMTKIGIIGSGQWAFALSKVLNKNQIIIKCRNLRKTKKKFLQSQRQIVTDDFGLLQDCEYIFLSIPSQSVRENLKILKNKTKNLRSTFIICCKGVEKNSNKLISEILFEFFPNSSFAILSGPNFSSEVIKGLPTAAVLSSQKKEVLIKTSKIISQERFRTYFNKDIIGTQIGGAMKNIIAIASGLIIGKNLGNNAKAAIITRGLSETVQLGLKMGAKKNTFYGLSGIGDLTLTCSSLKSRNAKLGYCLAKGGKISILKKNAVVEGLDSCESICQLGLRYDVELPICNSVKKIIYGENVKKIATSLLSRPLQYEK